MSATEKTIALAEPVTVDDHVVETLSIRRPNAGDIVQCGWPFTTNVDRRTGNVSLVVNTTATFLLLADLTGHPITTINKLSAFDLFGAVETLKGFFFHKPAKSSGSVGAEVSADGPIAAGT